MFHEIWMGMRDLIGLEAAQLTWWEMSLRAAIIYITAIALVRFGQKRFMGKNTAFDVILGIILGSVLSRAITGNSPFGPTIAAAAILVVLHWIFATASFHSHRFGVLIKGEARNLIEDGEILWDNMRRSHLSEKDLLGALYSNGSATDPADIKLARFERSGDISVIPREKEKKTRVIEIAVKEGVQVVRVEIEEG